MSVQKPRAIRCCQRGTVAYRMCPPSSWEIGSRFNIVTNMPTQPANATGWTSTAGVEQCTKWRTTRVTIESPSTAVSPSSPRSMPGSGPCPGSACQVRRQRVRAREQGQRIVVRDRPGQHGTCERRGQERRQKKHDVQCPALPPPPEGPRENEMPSVGLVGPVVAAEPVGEHRGECRGRPGMGRMYKRVNDFPIRKGCRPPRDQKRAQVHRAPLTRSAGNPTIALSYSFELPDSIFNPFTSPPRGFARRRPTEQRHTWISLN